MRPLVFVEAETLGSLPVPWPRRQELPAAAHVLTRNHDDLVVAVSHGWPCSAHPDPLGAKAAQIVAMVRQATEMHAPLGRTLVFFDWLSVTQRARTPDEEGLFEAALQEMPQLYLEADCVLHFDAELPPLPEDGAAASAPLAAVQGAALLQLRHGRVQSFSAIGAEPPHCFIKAIGGVPVSTTAQVAEALASLPPETSVRLQRAPYGLHNEVPSSERGWIFLERFCSMVKCALVDESEVPRVALSTSESVLRQIREGGERLRRAAQQGGDALNRLMKEFIAELRTKQFGGASADMLQRAEELAAIMGRASADNRRPVEDMETCMGSTDNRRRAEGMERRMGRSADAGQRSEDTRTRVGRLADEGQRAEDTGTRMGSLADEGHWAAGQRGEDARTLMGRSADEGQRGEDTRTLTGRSADEGQRGEDTGTRMGRAPGGNRQWTEGVGAFVRAASAEKLGSHIRTRAGAETVQNAEELMALVGKACDDAQQAEYTGPHKGRSHVGTRGDAETVQSAEELMTLVGKACDDAQQAGATSPRIGGSVDASELREESCVLSGDAVVVASLMQLFARQLAERWHEREHEQRQRQLALAMYRGDAEAVRALLASGADPNDREDATGFTLLHGATALRHIDVIQALLQGKADPAKTDLTGNTAAHLCHMYADPSTITMFSLLCPTERLLTIRNVAGGTPFTRFGYWAYNGSGSLDGSSTQYPPAVAKVEELLGAFPALQPYLDGLPTSNSPWVPPPAPAVPTSLRSTVLHRVPGWADEAALEVWRPTSVKPETHLLFLLGISPFTLVVDGLEAVAEALCAKYAAQLTVVAYSHSNLPMHASFRQTMHALYELVDSLPHIGPLVLVEQCGFVTGLAWHLRERLAGVVHLNVGMLYDECFVGSNGFKKMSMMADQMIAHGRARDAFKLGRMIGAVPFTGEQYRRAYDQSPNAWQQLEWWCQMIKTNQQSEFVFSHQPLFPPIQARILLGELAPAGTVSAVQFLQPFLPGSTVHGIPKSFKYWHAEGEVQRSTVIGHIEEVMQLAVREEGPCA